jgi:transcriptional regulator with XRE-family HTH domain
MENTSSENHNGRSVESIHQALKPGERALQGQSLGDWVSQAIKCRGISQTELSRSLQDCGLVTVDKSAVNKLMQGKRKLSADEMLAISAITKFPIPGVEAIPQPMREAPPKESLVEKVESPRPVGHTISEAWLRRLLAKIFEISRPPEMTPVLADSLAAAVLLVCRRPPDRQDSKPDEDQIRAQARALMTLFVPESSP